MDSKCWIFTNTEQQGKIAFDTSVVMFYHVIQLCLLVVYLSRASQAYSVLSLLFGSVCRYLVRFPVRLHSFHIATCLCTIVSSELLARLLHIVMRA